MKNTAPTNAEDRTPNATDQTPAPDDWDADGVEDSHESPERTVDLTATVVEYDCRPDECTIFPREASEAEIVTTWITAEEGSYVSLDEMR